MLSLVEVKIIAIVVLFLVSFLCGIFPVIVSMLLSRTITPSNKQRRYLNYITCFSGGVFFASAILVLLPEAREEAEKYFLQVSVDTDFPVTELLAGLGFFLILVSEQSGSLFSRRLSRNTDRSTKIKISQNNTDDECETGQPKETMDQFQTFLRRTENNLNLENGIKGTFGYSETSDTVHVSGAVYPSNITDTSSADDIAGKIANRKTMLDTASDLGADKVATDACSNDVGLKNNETAVSAENFTEEIETEIPKFSRVRTVILAVALSLHLVFDGMALGLQDNVSTVWSLLCALGVHKTVVAFSVGMFLMEIYKRKIYIIIAVTLFSAVSPCSVAIGIAITSRGEILVKSALSAILQGLASGTFIYVTFFEILQKEFTENTVSLRRTFSCLLGFASVAALKYAVKE